MAHSLPRIQAKLINNTPHLIDSESFQTLVDYIKSRESLNMSLPEMALANEIKLKNRVDKVLGEGEVAYIPISGTLSYEETMWHPLCGMTSYQGLIHQMRQAASEGYKYVVLDVDSGGGQAYQTFSTAKELRRIADENGITLISYVDGISASAAYAITSASHEVIAHPQAEVGSIGVVTRLINTSEKDKKEGISTTYVYAGGSKVPYAEDGSFREDFLSDMQERVDILYEEFVEHVSDMRGIEVAEVRATDAKMFTSDKAKQLGLIDKIMEINDFANYLTELTEGKKDMPLNLKTNKKEEKMSTENQDTPVVSLSQEDKEMIATMQAELAEMKKANAALEAEKQAIEAAKLEEVKGSLVKELTQFSFVSESDSVADALMSLDKEKREAVLETFKAADKALETSITEVLAEEVEETPAMETEQDKKRAALKAEIEKRKSK